MALLTEPDVDPPAPASGSASSVGDCPHCHGTGVYKDDMCLNCGGTGNAVIPF